MGNPQPQGIVTCSGPVTADHRGFWVFSPPASRALPVGTVEIDRIRQSRNCRGLFLLQGYFDPAGLENRLED
jgi:hypothetical protein